MVFVCTLTPSTSKNQRSTNPNTLLLLPVRSCQRSCCFRRFLTAESCVRLVTETKTPSANLKHGLFTLCEVNVVTTFSTQQYQKATTRRTRNVVFLALFVLNMVLEGVPRGVKHKKRPQKWVFQRKLVLHDQRFEHFWFHEVEAKRACYFIPQK